MRNTHAEPTLQQPTTPRKMGAPPIRSSQLRLPSSQKALRRRYHPYPRDFVTDLNLMIAELSPPRGMGEGVPLVFREPGRKETLWRQVGLVLVVVLCAIGLKVLVED